MEACFNVSTPYILSVDYNSTYTYKWQLNQEITNSITVSKEGIYQIKMSNSDGCFTEKRIEII